jgi:hypothetical protein
MRKGAVQIGNGRVAEFVEMTKDVGFRLGEIGHVPLDEPTDPVCRPMDAEDDLEAHRFQDTSCRILYGFV